ncbi:Scd6p NDAI_0G01050 [Naumovozyma dairenensis CBS 421]|uniref:DFDF domain-containing protein n=1 Tax=Naumovozyma dairenensis (strain ATCC 10597 / BCRC 20456 / CBS 421 / NBRC 0211 / NRRL Y-12639) TaxID=1071378 RepID=G0WDM0_NAUDC|nr:hypothetical protein NDAI_0G01050 [Naumovozyma dairenensis CBS 421]CCD25881.2 hypothetical protein NDAI_0G01050 [Naumovozyma dairenensis CBS 421]
MSQYIGKTISLISVTDNRYVGLLEGIDSEKGTVTLNEVRCFGTEGRKGWGPDEIYPTNNIYKSVKFNGNEVKDLSILEVSIEDVHPVLPPSATPVVPVPIAEQQAAPPQVPQAMAGYGVYAPNQGGITSTADQYQHQQQAQQHQQQQEEPAPSAAAVHQEEPAPIASVPTEEVASQNEQPRKEQQQQQQQQQQHVEGEEPRRHDHHPHNNEHKNHSHSHTRRSQQRNIEIPKSDFDFQSNNAKFTKQELSQSHHDAVAEPVASTIEQTIQTQTVTAQQAAQADPETFYNRKSSFFDTISTSTETNTNMRWQEEKVLNLDTFGQTSARPNFHGGRGGRGRGNYRGRGGRGRGNYRGRGGNRGGYNNNNRNNYHSSNDGQQFQSQSQPQVEF